MVFVYRLVTRVRFTLVAGVIAGCLAASLCSADTFSNPPATQSTVSFWLSIYTRYPLTQGVIHDSRYPEIVYDVIELAHPDAAGAYRINENSMRQARATYRRIL